jgi:N utilization substance protein B
VSDEVTPTTVGGRHRGREVALQVLYAIDVERAPAGEGQPYETIFARIHENFEVPTAVADFARELVSGVIARVVELDEIIGLHARNWRVARMAIVDRNVLRLAVYELRDTQTPLAVVIDEAVDLARRFGADSSPSFVNGVLDAVARELRAA